MATRKKTTAAKKAAPKKGTKGLSFEAELYAPMAGKGWTFLDLPANSAEALGAKARVAVRGTINGHPFTSSAMPTGKGHHQLTVNAQMRAGAKAEAGDRVKMVLEVDTAPREVKVPPELGKAIAASAEAKATWAKFPYSHRKLYVEWIEEAKRPETRVARIAKAVEMIAAGQKQR